MNYKDKIVVVTGAGEGIGRTIALHYAKAKAIVIVVDINEKTGHETVDLIYDLKGKGIYLKCDVTCEEDVKNQMEYVIHCYHRIDILINNVGTHYHKSIFDMTSDEWDKVMNTNLKSVFLCSREVAKYMRVMNQGAIVNISASDNFMQKSGYEAYAASKGGIVSMTKSLAASLYKYNIQVNCISPGYIETKGYRRLKDLKANQTIPIVDIEDIARACLHLTHEDNEYVNGSNFIIDKGLIRKVVILS